MSEDLNDTLARDYFINQVFGLVGPCPRCNSTNTHDCEASHFILDDMEIPGFEPKIIKMGSDCPIAKEVDDITIGHCDDCGYIWCLLCRREIDIDHPACFHWAICGDCGRTDEYPNDCPSKDEVEAGELLVNPCWCECSRIEECSHCPYEWELYMCPRIQDYEEAS